MNARAIPVLMYHHVSPNQGPLTISPSTFRKQMTYMANHGYQTLSAASFSQFMSGTEPIPDKCVVLSFDDGYLDNYLYAHPILKEFGLHAILFAVTGWIGSGPPRKLIGTKTSAHICPDHQQSKLLLAQGRWDDVILRWSEIDQMQVDKTFEVHSHSHFHVRWDQLYRNPTECLAAVRTDLEASLATLYNRTGSTSRHLCWPWGYFSNDYFDLAKSVGFLYQYTVIRGTNLPGADASTVRRIEMTEGLSALFRLHLQIFQSPFLTEGYLRVRNIAAVPARVLKVR